MINSSPQTMAVFVNGKTINVTYVVQDGKVYFLNAEGNAVAQDQIEDEQQVKEEIEATLAEIEQAKEIVEKKIEEEMQQEQEAVEEKTEEAQQATQDLNEAEETRQKDILEQQEKAEETRVEQEEKAVEAVTQEEDRVKSVLEEQKKTEEIRVEQEEKTAETTAQETTQDTSSSEEQKDYVRYPFPEYKNIEEIVDRIDESHYEKHVENKKEFENESYGEKIDINSYNDYKQHAIDTLMDPQTEFFVGKKGNNENTLFAYNDQTNTYIVVPGNQDAGATMYRPEDGREKFEAVHRDERSKLTGEVPELHQGIESIYPELAQEYEQREQVDQEQTTAQNQTTTEQQAAEAGQTVAPEVASVEQNQTVLEQEAAVEEQQQNTSVETSVADQTQAAAEQTVAAEAQQAVSAEAAYTEQVQSTPEEQKEQDPIAQINDKYDTMLEKRLEDLQKNIEKGYVEKDEIKKEEAKVKAAIEKARQDALKAEMKAAQAQVTGYTSTYSQGQSWGHCFRKKEYVYNKGNQYSLT